MEAIFDFAASPESEDPARFADFTARTTEAAEAAGRRLEERVEEGTNAMIAAATAALAQKTAAPSRTFSRWGALGAATMALAPLVACDRVMAPPPPDPVPQPTLVTGPPDAAPTTTTTTTSTERIMPPDPLPPPTIAPNDPVPSPRIVDAGTKRLDAGKPRPLPPDPLPPPTMRYPPPPDPPPPPHIK